MGAGGGGISAASADCLSFTRLASRAGESSSSRGRLWPVRRPLTCNGAAGSAVAPPASRALAAASLAAPAVLGDGFNLRRQRA